MFAVVLFSPDGPVVVLPRDVSDWDHSPLLFPTLQKAEEAANFARTRTGRNHSIISPGWSEDRRFFCLCGLRFTPDGRLGRFFVGWKECVRRILAHGQECHLLAAALDCRPWPEMASFYRKE